MASADESADEMMWKKLRGKLRTVGQIVDGNRRDTAAGEEAHCLSVVAGRAWTESSV